MFKLVLVSIILGLAMADNIDRDAVLLNYKNDPADADGNFAYAFDTSNGISIQESGNLAGVSGAAQWVSPEGVPIQLLYSADENGYHPNGEHLPQVPERILRALEYIRTHPQKE